MPLLVLKAQMHVHNNGIPFLVEKLKKKQKANAFKPIKITKEMLFK